MKKPIKNQQDFTIEIISRWSTKGIKFNNGNVNILKYAFIASVAWTIHRGESLDQRIINQYLEALQTNLWIVPVIQEPSQLIIMF